MSIEMVEGAVGLLAAVPAALVHPLDLFIAPSRSLVLLCTGDRYEGVDLLLRISLDSLRNID